MDGVKLAFSDISLDAFRRSSEELLKFSQSSLSAERRLQNHQLSTERQEFETRMVGITAQVERMQGLVRELERDRAGKFAEIAARLDTASENAQTLTRATQRLADALANTRVRGQWGERMAEDVLRLTGLIEHVNYTRQQALASGARPDFTFLLPNDLCLHMDVKFPFDNYLRSLEEETEAGSQRFRQTFVRDVRAKIGEVATRGYVAPDAGTLEFALLFIPNEQVYQAMFEASPDLLDEALARGVLMVSPISLIAILALVRRASTHLRLEKAAQELQAALADFRKAWDRQVEQQERMGRRLDDLSEDYRLLTGERRRSLDRMIDKVDAVMDGRDSGAGERRDLTGGGSQMTGQEIEQGGEGGDQDDDPEEALAERGR